MEKVGRVRVMESREVGLQRNNRTMLVSGSKPLVFYVFLRDNPRPRCLGVSLVARNSFPMFVCIFCRKNVQDSLPSILTNQLKALLYILNC